MEVYWSKMESPIGELFLAATNKGLCKLEFGRRGEEELHQWTASKFKGCELIRDDGYMEKYILQLQQYFQGNRREFDLNLDIVGTDFQSRVWNQLLRVEYGTTATYKDIAKAINNPKGVRAVGGANNKNPIPIIIPCHRIIGANGSLIGYGGGLDIKRALLRLEGIIVE